VERSGDGSAFGRLSNALIFGVFSAAFASALWFALAWVTGFEPTFLAVAVGFIVGGAVRAGSRARGGFGYQSLAMVLTYAAIAAAYAPSIAEQTQYTPYAEIMADLKPGQAVRIRMLHVEGALDLERTQDHEREAAWADALLAGSLDGENVPEFENDEGEFIPVPDVTDAERSEIETVHREFASVPMSRVVRETIPLALVAPFATKGWLFYVFVVSLAAGLWFAWRRNYRARSVVTGPFEIGGATA